MFPFLRSFPFGYFSVYSTMTMERRIGKQSAMRRLFQSRAFLITALVAAILIAISFARAYYQDYQIRQEIRHLEDQVAQLEKKKIESLDILQYVISPAFVEEKARTELNLKKEGEHVVRIDGLEASVQEETYVEEKQGLNNPQKWWYYIWHIPLPSYDA